MGVKLMPKIKEKPWQYTLTTILAGVTLLLVIGYFIQSFIEIRKVKPVTVAMERLSKPDKKPDSELGKAQKQKSEPVGSNAE